MCTLVCSWKLLKCIYIVTIHTTLLPPVFFPLPFLICREEGRGHLMMDLTKMRGCMIGLHILTEHKDANIGPISSLWHKMEQGKKKE